MSNQFETLPPEIRTKILQYAGFTYATLFDDDFAANFTYDPTIDKLETQYDQGNIKGIKWILRNVDHIFWRHNSLLADTLIRQDYKLFSYLSSINFEPHVVKKVPKLIVEDKELSISQESTFSNQPVFNLNRWTLVKLASHGLHETVLRLKETNFFVVDEAVIESALYNQHFDTALELMKAFNIKANRRILAAAAENMTDGETMELFARTIEDWTFVLRRFILLDSVPLVTYCYDSDHFYLTLEEFSNLLMIEPKPNLIQKFHSMIIHDPAYYDLMGSLDVSIVKEYLLPHFPQPEHGDISLLFFSMAEANNVDLFEYIVTEKWPTKYQQMVQRFTSDPTIILPIFRQLVRSAATKVDFFESFYRHTWMFIPPQFRSELLIECLCSMETDIATTESIIALPDFPPRNYRWWVTLFCHIAIHDTKSLEKLKWILNGPLLNCDLSNGVVLRCMTMTYDKLIQQRSRKEHEKALFLLEVFPSIIQKSEGHANFAKLCFIHRPLILKIMSLCGFTSIKLDYTNYSWLQGCSISDFRWIMRYADPEYIEWWDILDACQYYENCTLFKWLEVQKTFELACWNKSVEFCPKWK